MRAFWIALMITILLSRTDWVPMSVKADEAFEPITGVSVTEASATAAKMGGVSRLRFHIENYSGDPVVLTGITSTSAAKGALMIKEGTSPAREVNEFVLLPEESLNLKTSHIWLELRDLKHPLVDGDFIEFDLTFRQGVVPGIAHVHHHH